MTKHLIAYHQTGVNKDCPDGICAAWIAATVLGRENCELVGLVHQNKDEYSFESLPFDPKNKNIIMLDFSYPAWLMQQIAAVANSFVCLDHHEPRQKDIGSINGFSDRVLGIYSPNEVDCGATLTWKHFHGEKEEPWFLTAVFARDTGAFGYYDQECPTLEAIATQISAMREGKKGVDTFEVFDQLLEMNVFEVQDAGELLLKERNDATEIELREAELDTVCIREEIEKSDGTTTFIGHVVPLLRIQSSFLDKHYSYVGAKLAQAWKKSFVVIQTTTEPEVYHLRSHSSSPFHLGKIAEQHGGGGHQHAAGYNIKLDNLEES
jgi:single-stranded DNA-specific DHH superfamily exonuclease